jgi:hypothetical protein
MHGIALGTWLVLSVFLASLYMFVSSDKLAAVLPPNMVVIGSYVYSLAFGIGLFTSALALVIPSVAQRPVTDTQHGTLGSAIAKFGEPVVIILAVAASSFHLWNFGMKVATPNDMFSSAAAMVIADLAFLVAEKRTISELRARREGGRYDKFDLVLWGLFGLAVLGYLVLVNVYSVRYTAGTLQPDDPMLLRVIDFYGASPSILILCIGALALVTALVDKPAGGAASPAPATGGDERPWLVRQAATVKAARAALRGQPVGADRQLPAGTVAAKDGAGEAEELTDEDKRKIDAYAYVHDKSKTVKLPLPMDGHNKRSETGVPYDTTAELVMPDDEHNNEKPNQAPQRRGRRTDAERNQASGGASPESKS